MSNKDIREIFYSLNKISDKWDPYFDVYERYLSKYIDKQPKVLEIGVQNGGSIDMWLQYFGEGTQIVGIDIDPQCKQLSYPDCVEIVIGDQANFDFWNDFLQTHRDFDIIIDDGGHTMIQQVTSLYTLFPQLNLGGTYICEDTHTSYFGDWGGKVNNNNSFQGISKQLTDYLNKEHIGPGFISKKLTNIFKDELNSIHFYNSMVIFEKQLVKPFKRVFSNDRLHNN